MLEIDCDSIWRRLCEIGGQTLPECPLKIDGLASDPPVRVSPVATATQRNAALDLLAFIDSLAEQSLS